MKLLSIHAHFDDYEFTAAGTFELMRRSIPTDFHAQATICTDGAAGHHFRSREETARLRWDEQQASARIGKYNARRLRYPNGSAPREGCLQTDTPLLAALWQEIREFGPDYLFCPPIPSDPLAGIHVDHLLVAEAVRRVAFMLNVPHAYTPEFPSTEEARYIERPVILNVYDPYMSGANTYDLAVNIDQCFDRVAEMSWQHQSQVAEWLPWVGGHWDLTPPQTLDEWADSLRRNYCERNRRLGLDTGYPFEFFTVTAWGSVPSIDKLRTDFPFIDIEHSNLTGLEERLVRWGKV